MSVIIDLLGNNKYFISGFIGSSLTDKSEFSYCFCQNKAKKWSSEQEALEDINSFFPEWKKGFPDFSFVYVP